MMPGFHLLFLAATPPAKAAPASDQGIWKLDDFFDRSFISPNTLVGALLYGLIFLLAAYILAALIRRAIRRMVASKRGALMDRTLVQFLGELAQMAVYVLAVLLYAHLIPALHHIGTALLAGASVASLVLGLAAQQALGNLIAGLSLLLYRPFRLGDRLQVAIPGGTEVGSVESLDLGYTILRTDDNRQIIVPNSVIASQVNLNLSARSVAPSFGVVVKIAARADVDRARQILLEIGRARAGENQHDLSCHVTSVSGAGTDLTLTIPTAHPQAIAADRSDLLREIKAKLDAAEIALA